MFIFAILTPKGSIYKVLIKVCAFWQFFHHHFCAVSTSKKAHKQTLCKVNGHMALQDI